jgi:hypothetical protein
MPPETVGTGKGRCGFREVVQLTAVSIAGEAMPRVMCIAAASPSPSPHLTTRTRVRRSISLSTRGERESDPALGDRRRAEVANYLGF